ncbi:MAG: DNA polymerase III subunit delta' [bacterium]
MLKSVIGHKEIIERLTEAVEGGRVPSAYLFSGARGVGKYTVAKEFAKALNCLRGGGDACDECSSCRKVDSGNHADVRSLVPDGSGGSIRIDSIREMLADVSLRALEGRCKVYIIRDADRMTLSAANCLLKTLEEPPPGVVFLLTTTNINGILPTVRSRCFPVRFGRVKASEIEEALISRGVSPDEAHIMASLADGRPALVSRDILRMRDTVISVFNSSDTFFRKAEILSREGDPKELLDIAISWYRDLVLVGEGVEGAIVNSDKRDVLIKIGRKLGNKAYKAVELLSSTKRLLSQNANPRLSLEVMFMELEAL